MVNKCLEEDLEQSGSDQQRGQPNLLNSAAAECVIVGSLHCAVPISLPQPRIGLMTSNARHLQASPLTLLRRLRLVYSTDYQTWLMFVFF